MTSVLACAAAALVAVWGVAHAIPTRQVIAGFAPIEPDNRRIVTQEWLAEAFTMWGLAAIVVAATLAGSGTSVAAWVYRAGAGSAQHIIPPSRIRAAGNQRPELPATGSQFDWPCMNWWSALSCVLVNRKYVVVFDGRNRAGVKYPAPV